MHPRYMQLSMCFVFMALLALAAFPAAAQYAYKATAHAGIELVDLSDQKNLPQPDEVLQTDTITFNIIYEDTNAGFMDTVNGQMRRERLHDALEYVAEALGRSGTLDVMVEESTFVGGGNLAFGGTFFSASPGFQKPTSLRRLETGSKPFQNATEISIRVDFNQNWHFGAAPPSPGQFDFLSVLIHEVTHGMGFLSFMLENGDSELAPNVYSVYDRFMGNRDTGDLFFDENANFLSDADELNANKLGYVNAQSTTIYDQGGDRIPIFSPVTFSPGSSFSHVDFSAVAGNPVMTHAVSSGIAKRFFTPADLGVLRVIGYPDAVVDPGTLSYLGQGGNGGEGEGEDEGEGGDEDEEQKPKFLFCAPADAPIAPSTFAGDFALIGMAMLALVLAMRRQSVAQLGAKS